MKLLPLNDAVFGEPVVRDQNRNLIHELHELTSEFEATHRERSFNGGARTLTAALAPEKVPYQVIVTAVGPDCKEVQIGDLAILPKGGGTMVTITEGNIPKRVYMIAESKILCVLRDDE